MIVIGIIIALFVLMIVAKKKAGDSFGSVGHLT